MNKYELHKHKQSGATLIVSLVILTVITIIGVASIRSSNMELKMVASQRDRAVAFQTAESALKAIERQIAQNSYDPDQVIPGRCPGNNLKFCFDSTCQGGLCFDGQLDNASTYDQCQTASDNGQVKQFWRENQYWTVANEVDVPKVSDSTEVNEVKYLIEFMCFVPQDNLSVSTEANMVPLYRITVRAAGENGRANVMLQSVFRGPNLGV